MQHFPSMLNLMFHHRNLALRIYMLDNNQQNFQLNAMLIKHWNQEMNDKYLFHLSLDFFVHNHQVLKSKLLKMYLLNLADFKLIFVSYQKLKSEFQPMNPLGFSFFSLYRRLCLFYAMIQLFTSMNRIFFNDRCL